MPKAKKSSQKKTHILLSIIVVSYNTRDITLEAFRSAIADLKTAKLLSKTEFLVADNNSPDDSATAIKKYLKGAKVHHRVFANKDNKGFAGGNNQCLDIARGKYVILLNPDTITQKGTFKTLVETFEKNPPNEATAHLSSHRRNKTDRLGIIAPMLLNTDLTLQAQGGNFPTLLSLTSHMLLLDDLPFVGKLLPSTQHTGKNARMKKSDTELTPIDWVGGTAMMVRREVLNEIGGLDEGIFMYGEDIEYCFRAKNHHWDVAIQPRAKIIHLANAAAGSENAYTGEIKGYMYLWRKFKPTWQIPLAKFLLYAGVSLRLVLFSSLAFNSRKAGIYFRILRKIHTM